jgi:hypothetical protein
VKRLAQVVGLLLLVGVLLPGVVAQIIAAYKTRTYKSNRLDSP